MSLNVTYKAVAECKHDFKNAIAYHIILTLIDWHAQKEKGFFTGRKFEQMFGKNRMGNLGPYLRS